ncbi:anti-sigma factor antagonist [Streptomyces sp. SID14478]|uniref:anti-sigma factor antagonist n=1 Tax=Streptomyces sp. SID14478 TaxID=2706073 RepID=UPI0013DB6DF7|nr:anti-sigma factor antagonist [Streptomyces sp. SID14478]NEB77837.1 anti-sigma factor antagonist [Streptomyces sp. SID14478]
MRQGNQQDYLSDDFGDFHRLTRTTGADDSEHAPVIRTVGDCAVVELSGEIDLLAFHRTAPLLDAVTAGPYRVVVIDLTGTTFFDCSGLSLLVRARRRARARDGRVAVVCRHPLTLRIIELSGLTRSLGPVATVEEALR